MKHKLRFFSEVLRWIDAVALGVLLLFTPMVVHSSQSPRVTSLAAGGGHTCALLSNGTVRCWGDNEDGLLGNGMPSQALEQMIRVTSIESAKEIAAGLSFSCAVLENGRVKCWGENDHGQLGNGATGDSPIPVLAQDVKWATAVVAGFRHACALLQDGTIRCWGNNEYGQLGNGTTDRLFLPVLVQKIKTAVVLAAGDFHNCAVLKNGTVQCWGDNAKGQLGDGTRTSSALPVAVEGLTSVAALGAGSNYTCAVLVNGQVKCWGANHLGQLGRGSRLDSPLPVDVQGMTSAKMIDGGFAHTCALLSTEKIQCWGFNHAGQVGNGTQDDPSAPPNKKGALEPVEVVGITGARQVSTGLMHSCALLESGTVMCWGSNITSGYFSKRVGLSTSTPVEVQVIPQMIE